MFQALFKAKAQPVPRALRSRQSSTLLWEVVILRLLPRGAQVPSQRFVDDLGCPGLVETLSGDQ